MQLEGIPSSLTCHTLLILFYRIAQSYSESDIQIHALNPPFSLAEQTPKPLDTEPCPLGPLARNLIGGNAG